MDSVILIALFVFGAIFGSFSGAMIWRLKTGRKIGNERSECEHCHHKLSWLDLLPVVSWLSLQGKCRYCHKSIGWTPLILEIGLGIVFILSYLLWPLALTTPVELALFVTWLVSCVMLTILFVYDLRWYLLPDRIIWPLAGVGVVLFVLRALYSHWGIEQAAIELMLGLVPISGVYYVLHAVSAGRWVGFGDVKLGIFIGLALGWQGAILTLVLANFIGLVVILPGLLGGKFSRSSEIPFGPFLIVATVVAMLSGSSIIDWYLQLAVGGTF